MLEVLSNNWCMPFQGKARKDKPVEPARALLRLEELCAKAERCKFELRQKLYRWHVSPSDSDTIINSLIHRRFLDDERFARAFVKDKVMFGRWGRRKIQLALMSKRISSDTIRNAIEEIDEDVYMDNLREILIAKARSIDEPNTYDGRTKLFRFGASRGYEPELVARTIREEFIS